MMLGFAMSGRLVIFPSLSHCKVSPVSHFVSFCLQFVYSSMLFRYDCSLLKDGRLVLRVFTVGLAGVAVVRADDNVRRAFVVNRFLLFPTAGYDLSRISSLSACSLCISPCSFYLDWVCGDCSDFVVSLGCSGNCFGC
jgi:hypothetical protein